MTAFDFIPKLRRKKQLHGMTGTPEYRAWRDMKTRCYNSLAENYSMYGDRGVVVCERWRNDFLAFYEDMGPRPSAEYSLDRIDNNGDYEPKNCRWATREEQYRNTRQVHRIVIFNGEKMTLQELSRRTGMPYNVLYQRIVHWHWDIERALTQIPRNL